MTVQRAWKTVAELLGPRRGVVLSIPADATVHAALERLAEHDVGVLVVLDGEKPAGIFSERDLARKVELRGRTAKATAVREVMTPEVLYVAPEHTLDRCLALMKQDRVRHLAWPKAAGWSASCPPATSSWTWSRRTRSTSGTCRPTGW